MSEASSGSRFPMFDAAIVGIVAFLVLNVGLQFAPPHYSVVTQAVSDLTVGPYGWLMSTGFVVSGLSILAFVVGVVTTTNRSARSTIGLALMTTWGLAAVAIAFFTADVVDSNGYPGTSDAFSASPTTHGKIHLAIAAVVFLSMTAGIAVSSFHLGREPRLRPIQPFARAIAATAVVGLFLADPLGTQGIYGIMERSVSLLGFGWIVLVAWQLRREPSEHGEIIEPWDTA